ncbi:hypothetical protein B0T25DRAFT_514659 [Lasiosphaeria hispida]|uniref:Uncharacterized protein n=1 Tax=Lasiosphaeria hispida TaxID=260671 RepID=A0AAJ0HPW5_9PEZI|nr:hypothetical protein B0T25DRAFT_514659 [Lasiosphaeria hispida]
MPTPAFSFGLDASASPFHRPPVSSPLSSSPIRASSVSPLPTLAPRDTNSLYFRETQSSPITAKHQQQQPSKFKYASRNPRPNPVIKRREDAQESRRRLFLQNVRQRAEDQKWENRGGENELLKLEWFRLNRELQQAKESDIEGFVREEEIEDEPLPLPQWGNYSEPVAEHDSMMLDAIEQEEQAELDALLSSFPAENTETSDQTRPNSAHFDDDDYDSLFTDFLSTQHSQDVDMS